MKLRTCLFQITQEDAKPSGTKIVCPSCGETITFMNAFPLKEIPQLVWVTHYIRDDHPAFKNPEQDLSDGVLLVDFD